MKIKVCTFKSKDCCPDKCDMYNIEWDKRKIYARLKNERQQLKVLLNKENYFKKTGMDKTDKKAYNDLKREMCDKLYGMIYLTKAYYHLSGKDIELNVIQDVIDKTDNN